MRWKTPNLCANIFNVCMQENILLVCTSEGLMNNWIWTRKNPLHEKNMYLQFSSNESITLYYLLISTLHSLNRAGGRYENLGGAISIARSFDGTCCASNSATIWGRGKCSHTTLAPPPGPCQIYNLLISYQMWQNFKMLVFELWIKWPLNHHLVT